MTVIGVDQGDVGLRLHSCPSCGQHSWRSGDREVDRAEVLDALRVAREHARRRQVAARAPAPAAAAAPPDELTRREELQRLLGGFTVHGTTS